MPVVVCVYVQMLSSESRMSQAPQQHFRLPYWVTTHVNSDADTKAGFQTLLRSQGPSSRQT